MPIAIAWHSAGMGDVRKVDDWEDDALRTRLGSMRYPKRRLEARMGRWTAKVAVARALGLDHDDPRVLSEVLVRNAFDGAPEVHLPTGEAPLTIAMTDRADWAVCAIVEGPVRVGCDLELVEPRTRAFVRDYFTPSEQRLVDQHDDHDLATNLIWSAKESALKVLRTGLRRDTRSVEVVLESPSRNGWQPMEVHDAEGGVFPGWWISYREFVLTIAAAAPSSVPESFVTPPPLASAIPGHSWMNEPIGPSTD